MEWFFEGGGGDGGEVKLGAGADRKKEWLE